jgi:hypothetical protein
VAPGTGAQARVPVLLGGFELECGLRLGLVAFWRLGGDEVASSSITWVLAVALASYLVENLWMDAWIRAKFAGVPTLVPEPLTFLWFVVFAAGGVGCVVLVVCFVLVIRHRSISSRRKLATGLVVFFVCVLWGLWFGSTSGMSSAAAAANQQKHSVTLTWNASTSAVVGYNVYRSTVSGHGYVKINAALVRDQLSYKDENVKSGKTYYYVTRAVDVKGNESGDSGEIVVRVP